LISSFGYLILALAFLLALYGLVILIYGLIQKIPAFIESARLALVLIFPLVTAGMAVMVFLLLNDRFDVAYVYSVSSREMPAYLKLTALWGGQEGSLLFWSWLLSGFSLVFASRKFREERDLFPWAMLVSFVLLIFFLGLNVFLATPFERFWHFSDGGRLLSVFQPQNVWLLTPRDGQGLNPLLRHPGMIWHPLRSTWALWGSLFHLDWRLQHWSQKDGTDAGSNSHAHGYLRRGYFYPWDWCLACAGLMMSWVGAVIGDGTPLR